MDRVRDYQEELRKAVAEARGAGLHAEAAALQEAITAACTTSSELLGVQGKAIVLFLRSTQGRLPEGARLGLEACLKEIGKVWPRLTLCLWQTWPPAGAAPVSAASLRRP